MTRLNMTTIWITAVVSLLCYSQVRHHTYGRYFVEALETIHYKGLEDMERQALFNSAMDGMARAHDQYSSFIPRTDKESYVADLDQHFSGIGIVVEMDAKTKHIIVVNTIIGKPHPAHDAGMRSGDRIVAIKGVLVEGKSLSDAVGAIRGREGEPVSITVIHEGEEEPVQLSVIRADIAVDSVLGDLRDKNGRWRFQLVADPRIAYIRLTSFGDLSDRELRDALHALKRKGALDALIVDVRDNAGGYLTKARQVCDMFIPGGTIVITKGREGRIDEQYLATPDGTFEGFPMVVLINGESASASEIFAACMQDHERAVVVGTRTFGKGSVQQMIPMEAGRSLLKLTTASFWRPSDKNIHRLRNSTEADEWGVRPDPGFEVPLSVEQQRERFRLRRQRDAFRTSPPAGEEKSLLDVDLQLDKAIKYLQTRLGNRLAA